MTAPTNDAVLALNHAAQDLRLRRGELDTKRTLHASGYRLYVGDEIVTRRNDRDLLTDRGFPVHNRDQWIIERLHRDRSITVVGAHGRVRLPAQYVNENVELGYAQTAHGAQGRTVDRSLTLIDAPVDARGICTGHLASSPRPLSCERMESPASRSCRRNSLGVMPASAWNTAVKYAEVL